MTRHEFLTNEVFPVSVYTKLSPKLHARVADATTIYLFWCPGCNEIHGLPVRKDKSIKPNWEFNGNLESPSFTPSLIRHRATKPMVCHVVVTDGKIIFQGDCDHELAGKTVDMVTIPEEKA